jgi:mercuric ion binding protein
MSRYTAIIFGMLLASLSFPVLSASTTKITVNGMVCAFCAQGIEKRLLALPEAQAVYVDLKQRTVAIESKKDMALDEKTLRSEITDAGYDVVSIEVTDKTVADIKAEMSKGDNQ